MGIYYNNSYKACFGYVLMGLEDIAVLEALGKVTQKDRRGKGNHTVIIKVKDSKKAVAVMEASKYIASQRDVSVDSLNYVDKKGKLTIQYHDVRGVRSKGRGSTGCGVSSIPYFQD